MVMWASEVKDVVWATIEVMQGWECGDGGENHIVF